MAVARRDCGEDLIRFLYRPGWILGVAIVLAAVPAPASAAPAGRPVTESDAKEALAEVRRLESGRQRARRGRELTPLLRDLALGLAKLDGRERRQARRYLARPDDFESSNFGGYTVPPAEPFCSAHFCVHYVRTSEDAPDDISDSNDDGVPNFVEKVANSFETSLIVENDALGWRRPISDAQKGEPRTDPRPGRTDVYIQELGESSRIFGYAAPEPTGQSARTAPAYLGVDDSFTEYGYSDPMQPLQVTAAHEYNHVLQFAYDLLQDTWMFESTATWMEDRVFDAVNDYTRYLTRWVQNTSVPLTRNDSTKIYGSAVWNIWLDERRGHEAVRRAWERSLSTNPSSFAPLAYDAGITQSGGAGFFDEFTRFSAAVSEWRLPRSGFSEGASFPDVERVGSLAIDGPAVTQVLDHTTFALLDVPPQAVPEVRLEVSSPAGTAGAIALVARAGDASTTRMADLPAGGAGSVTLERPGDYQRITAVLVNADISQSGFDSRTEDWLFTKERQPYIARLTTGPPTPPPPADITPPALSSRSPAPGATQVATGSPVTVGFSEFVSGVSADTFRLADAAGRGVAATVSYDPGSSIATLVPTRPLSDGERYTARLTGGIVDRVGNSLALTEWTFTTAVRPAPTVTLTTAARQRGRTVLRNGLTIRLRTSAVQTASYSLTVTGDRRSLGGARTRTVARRSGSIRPGGSARLVVRLSASARRALRTRRPMRLTVQVRLTTASGDTARSSRTVLVTR